MQVARNISPQQIVRCLAFATKIIEDNNQYNRFKQNNATQINRTYIGKLAELIFYDYLVDQGIAVQEGDMFQIFPGAENADGSDFTLPNGKTIDIKTASLAFHKRIMVPISQFHLKKDYYVGIRLFFDTVGNSRTIRPESITRAVIHGYATRQALENRPTEHFGEGPCKAVLLTSLMPIEGLVEGFRGGGDIVSSSRL